MYVELREGEVKAGLGELGVEALIVVEVDSPIVSGQRPSADSQIDRAVGHLAEIDLRSAVSVELRQTKWPKSK